jgi:hypothetical protein
MTTLNDWLHKIRHVFSVNGPQIDEVRVLTRQFHVTLRASIAKVEDRTEEPTPKALKRISEISAKKKRGQI